jgi:hypothetical protein
MNKGKHKITFAGIVFLILSGFTGPEAAGQLNLRHVQGVRYTGVSAAYDPGGINLGVHYGLFLKHNTGVAFGAYYEPGRAGTSNYRLAYGLCKYFYTAMNYRRWLYFNLEAGILLGNEKVENSILEMDKSKFQYGFAPGILTEIYLHSSVKFDFHVQPRIMPDRQTGTFDVITGIGISYNF